MPNDIQKNDPLEGLNLIALRKYACSTANKTNEWYLKCVDCPKNSLCATGKRVVDILNTQTKPERTQIEKFNERLDKKERLDVQHRFLRAAQEIDPVGWLVENGYYANRKSAYNNYITWKQNNPEEANANDSGLFTRSVSSVGLVDGRQASVVGAKKGGLVAIEKAKNDIRKLFDGVPSEDRLKRFLTAGAKKESNINYLYNKIYRWCTKYDNLKKEYGLNELRKTIHSLMTKYGPGITTEELLNIMYGDCTQENDEISVEDFLNGLSKDPEEAIEKHADDSIEEVQEPPVNTVESGNRDFLIAEFTRKRKEIREGKETLLCKIKELQDLIDELNKKEETLTAAASLFGLAPINKI